MREFVAIILYLCLCGQAFGKLVFQIEPKTTDCFGVDARAGDRLKLTFFVLRGGLLDIDLRITGPNDEQIYSGLQFESSQFEWTANTAGAYQICWNNEMARWTAKVVQFDLVINDGSGEKKTDLLTKNTLSPLEDSIQRISNSLDQVQNDQRFLRLREQAHRDTAESTNTRVLWYSIIESVLLVGISLGQVYYLRKFFEIKRTV